MRFLRLFSMGFTILWISLILSSNKNQAWAKNTTPIMNAKQSVVTLYVMKGNSAPTPNGAFVSDQTRSPSPDGKSSASFSWGSGVLLAPSILFTSYHLVQNAQKIEVVFENGIKKGAFLLKTVPSHDLAALQLQSVEDLEMTPLPIGDETALEEGEEVFAIGNLWGLPQSISKGVISCLNRRLPTSPCPLIQTDAALGPGSSGGALLNSQGDIVGLTTAIFDNKDPSLKVGFAIPARFLKTFLESLRNSL